MRLRPSFFVSFLGVALLLGCGDSSAPKVAQASDEGPTGFFNESASGGNAAGGASASTSAGGGTHSGLGGTTGTGSGTAVDPDPTGGSGGANAATGGNGSGSGDTGGQGAGGTLSGGTSGTAVGGRSSGGRSSGGVSAGGRTSIGGSTGAATGGTAQGGTDGDCTDDLNPDEPETSCATWKEWGCCDEAWMIEGHICDRTCGRCNGSSTGGNGSSTGGNGSSTGGNSSSTGGNSSGPTDLPNVTNGQQGWATRYWDCCKPSCGWSENASRPVVACDQNNQSLGNNFSAGSACSGGNAHTCWRMAPWSVSSNVAYGFAAFNGAACGTCFQLDFSGSSHNGNTDEGSRSLSGKHMIVQVINTGGIGGGQFDLLVPGGGVGDFNACSSQWGTSDLGAQYGGIFLSCAQQNNYNYEPSRTCAKDWCQKVFSGKQDLLDGCLWYVEWAGMADNPNLTYGQVSCPAELTAAASG
ncbi:MAG: hypothetical protein JW940_34795 [Polyangiaceae bacterium]|nr:hypothetical protein [Polyangiaceae bacterium]